MPHEPPGASAVSKHASIDGLGSSSAPPPPNAFDRVGGPPKSQTLLSALQRHASAGTMDEDDDWTDSDPDDLGAGQPSRRLDDGASPPRSFLAEMKSRDDDHWLDDLQDEYPNIKRVPVPTVDDTEDEDAPKIAAIAPRVRTAMLSAAGHGDDAGMLHDVPVADAAAQAMGRLALDDDDDSDAAPPQPPTRTLLDPVAEDLAADEAPVRRKTKSKTEYEVGPDGELIRKKKKKKKDRTAKKDPLKKKRRKERELDDVIDDAPPLEALSMRTADHDLDEYLDDVGERTPTMAEHETLSAAPLDARAPGAAGSTVASPAAAKEDGPASVLAAAPSLSLRRELDTSRPEAAQLRSPISELGRRRDARPHHERLGDDLAELRHDPVAWSVRGPPSEVAEPDEAEWAPSAALLSVGHGVSSAASGRLPNARATRGGSGAASPSTSRTALSGMWASGRGAGRRESSVPASPAHSMVLAERAAPAPASASLALTPRAAAQEHGRVQVLNYNATRLAMNVYILHWGLFTTLRKIWRWDNRYLTGSLAAIYAVVWWRGDLLAVFFLAAFVYVATFRVWQLPPAEPAARSTSGTVLARRAGDGTGLLTMAPSRETMLQVGDHVLVITHGLADLLERCKNLMLWRSPLMTLRYLGWLLLLGIVSLQVTTWMITRLPGLLLFLLVFVVAPMIEHGYWHDMVKTLTQATGTRAPEASVPYATTRAMLDSVLAGVPTDEEYLRQSLSTSQWEAERELRRRGQWIDEQNRILDEDEMDMRRSMSGARSLRRISHAPSSHGYDAPRSRTHSRVSRPSSLDGPMALDDDRTSRRLAARDEPGVRPRPVPRTMPTLSEWDAAPAWDDRREQRMARASYLSDDDDDDVDAPARPLSDAESESEYSSHAGTVLDTDAERPSATARAARRDARRVTSDDRPSALPTALDSAPATSVLSPSESAVRARSPDGGDRTGAPTSTSLGSTLRLALPVQQTPPVSAPVPVSTTVPTATAPPPAPSPVPVGAALDAKSSPVSAAGASSLSPSSAKVDAARAAELGASAGGPAPAVGGAAVAPVAAAAPLSLDRTSSLDPDSSGMYLAVHRKRLGHLLVLPTRLVFVLSYGPKRPPEPGRGLSDAQVDALTEEVEGREFFPVVAPDALRDMVRDEMLGRGRTPFEPAPVPLARIPSVYHVLFDVPLEHITTLKKLRKNPPVLRQCMEGLEFVLHDAKSIGLPAVVGRDAAFQRVMALTPDKWN